jgi:hypothetical protein
MGSTMAGLGGWLTEHSWGSLQGSDIGLEHKPSPPKLVRMATSV